MHIQSKKQEQNLRIVHPSLYRVSLYFNRFSTLFHPRYIKSNKQEQNLRDVRIAPVWEGTTGIQALDLLARKIMLQKLKPIHAHLGEVYAYAFAVAKEGGGTNLRRHALTVLAHAAEWQYLTYRLALKAGSDRDSIGAASVPYLMYAG